VGALIMNAVTNIFLVAVGMLILIDFYLIFFRRIAKNDGQETMYLFIFPVKINRKLHFVFMLANAAAIILIMYWHYFR